MELRGVTCSGSEFRTVSIFLYAFIDTSLEVGKCLSHSSVERYHSTCAVCLGAHSTELETVSGEGEWRRAVAVGVVYEQLGNLWQRQRHLFLVGKLQRRLLVCLLNVVKEFADLLSEERADNSWRSLVSTQTVGVCSTHYRGFEESVMTIDGHQRFHYECGEAQVLLGGLSWCVEQRSRVRRKTPVTVLS